MIGPRGLDPCDARQLDGDLARPCVRTKHGPEVPHIWFGFKAQAPVCDQCKEAAWIFELERQQPGYGGDPVLVCGFCNKSVVVPWDNMMGLDVNLRLAHLGRRLAEQADAMRTTIEEIARLTGSTPTVVEPVKESKPWMRR